MFRKTVDDMRDEIMQEATGSGPAQSVDGSVQLSFRSLLAKLVRGEDLKRGEASLLLDSLLAEEVTDAQISAALVALAAKGETVEELVGMAGVMRSRARRIRARHRIFMDTAGTGSSAAKTFNVSTAAAFVTAAAGLPVAKHGSRAVTSLTGSADVLTALGVGTTAPPELMEKCLNEVGICFMFAPLYHPATARVAAVRRELGIHTVFNLLGPLTNPAGAPRQIVGVWRSELVEPLAHALAILGAERAWVVHGLDGLDEITISGKTRVAEARGGKVDVFEIEPEDFGLRRAPLSSVRVVDAQGSASVVAAVLSGERRDEARSLVVANAAAALFVGGAADNLRDAALLAQENLESGAAKAKLEELKRATSE